MYLYDVCVYIYIRGVGGLREGVGEGWRRETGRERERERERERGRGREGEGEGEGEGRTCVRLAGGSAHVFKDGEASAHENIILSQSSYVHDTNMYI